MYIPIYVYIHPLYEKIEFDMAKVSIPVFSTVSIDYPRFYAQTCKNE